MSQALSRIQKRLLLVTTTSLALSPLFAYTTASIFGMFEPRLLFSTSGIYLIATYSSLLAWCAVHFTNFTKPVIAWHDAHASSRHLPESLCRHLHSFSNRYWGFFLLAVIILPTIQYLSGVTSVSLLQSMLLQLVVAVLVGMPGYLFSLTTLGRLHSFVGLSSVQVSIKTKMLLIGAYLPVLTTALLLYYYWQRTGHMEGEIILAWSAISLVAFVITAVAIHSLHQSLHPVRRAINKGGASSYRHLANRLRPYSSDEIGYLTRMLGNQFERLAEQESHVSAIVDHAAEGIIVLDENLNIDVFNPAAEKLFGYQCQEIRGKPLRWLLPDLSLANNNMKITSEQEVFGRHSNGSSIPVQVRISQMTRDKQKFHTLLVADISERKAAQQKLLEAESRYRNLVETAHDLVWSIDTNGEWIYLNNAVSQIYGYRQEEMLNRHFSDFQAPESSERDAAAFEQIMKGKELFQYETVHLDKNGERIYISLNARPVFDDKGEVSYICGTARDITEQKHFEQELTYQAQHDTLTGLYNRSYFQSELERVISRIARSGAECALLYLDLDQFKYVNDTVGHAAGDRLLKECTELLRKNIREGDLLARFGGDEFTILLYNIDHSHALPVAENIRNMFEHYRFMDSGQTFNVTCSIGLSMIDADINSADEALSRADLACNISKAQGRNCVHEYTDLDHEKSIMTQDIGWASRVSDAIDNNSFKLFYQPIVQLDTNQIHGYEVLLRLPTDDGDSIKPGGFIPAAERLGLIHNIDRWAVRHAMETLARLQGDNFETRFSINLSARAIDDHELLLMIQDILATNVLKPESLTFELTEASAIANMQAARNFISKLKDLGCHVALDDFGAGFCSFTYLKHLPVDTLKIDGSFIQGLMHGHVDQAMVHSMNQVAHALGKTTSAEFVENHETLVRLKEIGIDFAQGHYLGRPSQTMASSLADDVVNTPLTA